MLARRVQTVFRSRIQTVFRSEHGPNTRSEHGLNSLNAEHCFLNSEQCSGPTLGVASGRSFRAPEETPVSNDLLARRLDEVCFGWSRSGALGDSSPRTACVVNQNLIDKTLRRWVLNIFGRLL